MDRERRHRLMFRWSLFTAALIAAFWMVWYRTNGSVPSVTHIKMTQNWTIELPFAISRWWDILIGPIWSVSLIAVLTKDRSEALKKNLITAIIFTMPIVLLSSLIFGLPDVGLTLGLTIVVPISVLIGLIIGLFYGLVSGLAVGLITGLVTGLFNGLAFGLILELALGLIIGLIFMVCTVFQLFFSSPTFKKFSRWLMAR